MERIGILTCLKTNRYCARAACLNAFNHRTDFFKDYPADTELTALMTCNGCKEENPAEPENDEGMLEKIERLGQEGITKVHVGVCRLRKDGNKEECERITKICQLMEEQGILVIKGTHRE